MIVIGIMLILVTLAATTMRPDIEGRRIRESARSVNVYLASARNRAMETGRPAGVIFRRLNATAQGACSMDIDQCEVPPCYCGETEYATATVQAIANSPYIMARLCSDYTLPCTYCDLPSGIVRPNDLIQFNFQGPMYRIVGADDLNHPNNVDSDGFVTAAANVPIYVTISNAVQNRLVPWPDGGQSAPMPYRIFRAPMKGGAQPLELPAGAVVDFTASGENQFVLNNARYQFSYGGGDVAILFSPTGGIDKIYVSGANGGTFMPTNPIYLLVGKREKLLNPHLNGNQNPDTMTNYQDQNNIWVVINPQTGLINTEPLGDCTSAADVPSAVTAARSLALEAKGMGGR